MLTCPRCNALAGSNGCSNPSCGWDPHAEVVVLPTPTERIEWACRDTRDRVHVWPDEDRARAHVESRPTCTLIKRLITETAIEADR